MANLIYSVSDCEINPLWTDNPPLFIRPKGSVIVYPSNGDSLIGLKNEEIIDISCPGGQVFVSGRSIETVFSATCEYGTRLRIFHEALLWNQVSSCVNSTATTRFNQMSCEGGSEAAIGFSLDDGRYINQITLCFDKYKQTTLYTVYDLVPWKSTFKSKPRFPIEDKEFFNVGSRSVFQLYTKKVQRDTVNQLLGLSNSSTKYIGNGNLFLSRGHIAAAADFYYPSQINATYRYVNMAPQWQSINGQNWNQVEIDSRNYANAKGVTLNVWAGTYAIATLPNEKTSEETELYLYVEGSAKALPVPAMFWKLLYNSDKQKGIVLIVLNNPYLKSTNVSLQIICPDISAKVGWLKWNKTDIENGYSYACSISDFKKIVKYAPNLNVNGLLL